MNPLNLVSKLIGASSATALASSGSDAVPTAGHAAIAARLRQCQKAADDAGAQARKDHAAVTHQLDQKQAAQIEAQQRGERLRARIAEMEATSQQQAAELSRQAEAASATFARGVAANDGAVEAAGAERLADVRRKQAAIDADAAQLDALRRESAEADRAVARLHGEVQALKLQQVRALLVAAWAEHDMAMNAPAITAMRLMQLYLDNGLLPPAALQSLHLIWMSADRALIGGVQGVGSESPAITATNLRAAARHFAQDGAAADA